MSFGEVTLFRLFLFSLFSIPSFYLVYNISNNDLDYIYNNTGNVIQNCLFIISLLVDNLVRDYFYTFRYCWGFILVIFDSMITNYIIFLGYLVKHMLVYPTCIVLGITSSVLLWIARLIIKDIFSIKFKK